MEKGLGSEYTVFNTGRTKGATTSSRHTHNTNPHEGGQKYCKKTRVQVENKYMKS